MPNPHPIRGVGRIKLNVSVESAAIEKGRAQESEKAA